MDIGKDSYAFQTYFNSADNKDVLGIAWASNWQYGEFVSTAPWRSSMSLVKNFTIQQYAPNLGSLELDLNSQPVSNLANRTNNETSFQVINLTLSNSRPIAFNISKPTGVFEFSLTWTVDDMQYDNTIFADFSIFLRSSKDKSGYLKLGFEANAGSFYIDRGHSEVTFVNENPYFTDRLSIHNEPYEITSSNVSSYKVYGVFDKNLLELYFKDGSEVTTNLFFFTEGNFVGEVQISTKHSNILGVQNSTFQQLK